MTEQESPALVATSEPGHMEEKRFNDSNVPRKWKRVLRALLTGRSYNRFEAERELADHCLHSTVAELQQRGLLILRQEEMVPGYQGIPTRVMRYWLAKESRERALGLLQGRAGRRTTLTEALS
jgi:hypothetical protein